MPKTGTCTGDEKLVLQRPFPRAVTFDTCHNGGSRPSTPENSGGQRSVCIRHALSRRLPLALLFPVAVVLRDCPRRTAPPASNTQTASAARLWTARRMNQLPVRLYSHQTTAMPQ